MGTTYKQLTIAERCEMARLQREGYSKRQIAASLDRSASTIARELRRNSSRTKGYEPGYAQQQAWARRWRGSKLDRDPALREQVLAGLQAGWSPEQVAGRLALERGGTVVSHETIYRFVHAQGNRTKDHAWFRLLPRGARPNGAGASAREATPLPIYTYAAPWPSVPKRRTTVASPAIGRPT